MGLRILMAQPPHTLAVLTALQSSWAPRPHPSADSPSAGKEKSHLEKTTLTPGTDQLLGKSPDIDSADVAEGWNPPIMEYPFVERARIADTFSALMPSQLTGKELLLNKFRLPAIWQRFARLCQPSRRRKPFNWSKEATAGCIVTFCVGHARMASRYSR